MKFAFIHAEKAQFPVSTLCALMGVTRQGYYAYAGRPQSKRLISDRELCERVRALHAESRGTCGGPRIREALRREGRSVSKTRVERTMRGLGLSGRVSRRPLNALHAALKTRRPAAGLLHHSDRGCQYTSDDYRRELGKHGIEVSMSRRGNCWDNAVAESFFATLKTELIFRQMRISLHLSSRYATT